MGWEESNWPFHPKKFNLLVRCFLYANVKHIGGDWGKGEFWAAKTPKTNHRPLLTPKIKRYQIETEKIFLKYEYGKQISPLKNFKKSPPTGKRGSFSIYYTRFASSVFILISDR